MSNKTPSSNAIQYKPGRDRPTGHIVNGFEAYADTSLVTYWRTYKGKSANYNHDTDVATVVNVSNAIDLVENNEDAMDQIIWGMTHPDDINPGVASIVANPALIDLLLVRHYKKWGGLVLPPLQAARGLQDAYEVVAEQEKNRGLQWGEGRSLMKYPNWRETRSKAPPPGFQAPIAASAMTRGPRGDAGRGRGGNRGRGGFGGGY
ncbi:hypothetical protein ACET3X_002193 [Alternaria dauci]|uniref:Uncharacterized protein n=1 Tax=Alternaria dauci TaxID=48095 RepID=A0ABR3URT5_9PLEO